MRDVICLSDRECRNLGFTAVGGMFTQTHCRGIDRRRSPLFASNRVDRPYLAMKGGLGGERDETRGRPATNRTRHGELARQSLSMTL